MALGGHFDVLVPDHPNGALPFRRCRILLLDTQRQAATESVSASQITTTPERVLLPVAPFRLTMTSETGSRSTPPYLDTPSYS